MKVYTISTTDRTAGIQTLLEQFSINQLKEKKVVIKANFNSADPFPASTHPDTVKTLLDALECVGAEGVLAERSGMGKTQDVLEKLGIMDLIPSHVLDSLPMKGFSQFQGEHWSRGFLLANVFLEADYVISTCCLKTHRFGGHFTLSLKNAVGAIARYDPEDNYDYMRELHQSPHQRKMIAEINTALPCDLVILDGIKGFSTEGPDKGTLIEPQILAASTDRVAIDVVGVALLRHYKTTPEVEKGLIFEQEQIKRAVELGIGVQSADDIEIVPLDEKSRTFMEELEIS